MRIGIDYHWASGIFRGTNTYVQNLVSELGKLDNINKYFLFSAHFNNNKSRYENIIHRRMYTNSGRFNMILGFPYRTFMDRLDIFHSQYITPLTMSCKRIVTIHDVLFETHLHYFPNPHRSFLRILTPLTISKTSKIITVSEFTKKELMRLYSIPSSKIHVISEGVSKTFKKFAHSNLIKQKLMAYNIDSPYLLYVGRIAPIKNVSGLLIAFNRLRQKGHQNLKLVIVGEKDELYKEERCFSILRQLHLTEYVVFIEGVSEEMLAYLYNGAEAFVLLSFGEGFGLPVLEAMACGTPVVASNVCSMPEIVDEAAILVNPYNTAETVEAIQKVLINSKLRDNLITKGLQRVGQFSWEECAKKTLQVYEEVYKN